MLNPDVMYSLRLTNLLALPQSVQDVISKMPLAPVAPSYIRKPNFKKYKKTAETDNNWREEMLADLKATIRNKDDPDYESIIGIINRLVATNIQEKSALILDVLGRRDDAFRMRAVNLMFDRGVSAPFYAKVMADLLDILSDKNPGIREDLQVYCSMDTFVKLFDDAKVVTFPEVDDPEFEDRVCTWTKQKELRRGFAIFATELYLRGLVPNTLINEALGCVLLDLESNIRKSTNKILSESVDQIITCMSEISKLTEVSVIEEEAKKILDIPRDQCHNLGMRSRFKLEDCVRRR